MSRLLAQLGGLALAGASGCMPPIAGLFVEPPCSDPRYTSGAYDAGATLDVSPWVLIWNSGPAELWLIDPSTQSVPSSYGIGMTSGAPSFSIRGDGLVALATETGFLGLAQLPAPGEAGSFFELQPTTVRQLNAAAVAWSRDGQRLAVIRRADGGGLQLLLLDEELAVLSETAIDLKQTDYGLTPYVVSWSPDDTQLALSTHIFDDRLPVNADCLLVDLASAGQHRLSLANVYFVGADLIVGTEQTVERAYAYDIPQQGLGPVYQMQLASGEVVSRTPVPDTLLVVASDPFQHTFVTVELARCWFNPGTGFSPAMDGRLRDTEGHFSVLLTELYGWTWGPFVLLPADVVEQWPAAAP